MLYFSVVRKGAPGPFATVVTVHDWSVLFETVCASAKMIKLSQASRRTIDRRGNELGKCSMCRRSKLETPHNNSLTRIVGDSSLS
ncbi:hypothetical protein SBA2_20008 [Acidobacteriia bacterium SbA2]|nr:hypothetical protein SBA2_20008 [Acidobacteriia bacterium SbA2]